jgi:hypothetical protein
VRALAALAFWGGTAVAVLAPTAAACVVSIGSREVIPVSPHAPEVVEVQRAMWTPGEPVAAIYGIPAERTWVVMPDRSKIVTPAEDPSLVLMTVDKQRGENPLRIETVWFVAGCAALGGACAAALGAIALAAVRA